MKAIILITSLILNVNANAKPLVVAIIDTGIDSSFMKSSFLCPTGHKDFTNTSLHDYHGHGTHVSGLIDQYVKNKTINDSETIEKISTIKADYCQIILKYFDPKHKDPLKAELQALRYAIDMKVDYINFSGGGVDFSHKENLLIKEALKKGIKIIVAAGNNGTNLSKLPFYPAILDNRLYVVGNLSNNNVKALSSNYGPYVNSWEKGVDSISYGNLTMPVKMSGTSQATAIKTGKLIRKQLFLKKIYKL